MAEVKVPNMVQEEGIAQPKSGYAGRPPGTKNKWSTSARKRLEELGFDPIQKMIDLYDQLEGQIFAIQFYPDGTKREKVSALALSNMVSTQQKIANDLMRYGYARAPETNETKINSVAPMVIQLSKAGDKAPTETGEDYSDIPKDLLDENGDGETTE